MNLQIHFGQPASPLAFLELNSGSSGFIPRTSANLASRSELQSCMLEASANVATTKFGNSAGTAWRKDDREGETDHLAAGNGTAMTTQAIIRLKNVPVDPENRKISPSLARFHLLICSTSSTCTSWDPQQQRIPSTTTNLSLAYNNTGRCRGSQEQSQQSWHPRRQSISNTGWNRDEPRDHTGHSQPLVQS